MGNSVSKFRQLTSFYLARGDMRHVARQLRELAKDVEKMASDFEVTAAKAEERSLRQHSHVVGLTTLRPLR